MGMVCHAELGLGVCLALRPAFDSLLEWMGCCRTGELAEMGAVAGMESKGIAASVFAAGCRVVEWEVVAEQEEQPVVWLLAGFEGLPFVCFLMHSAICQNCYQIESRS